MRSLFRFALPGLLLSLLNPGGALAVPLYLGFDQTGPVVGSVRLVDIVPGIPDGAIHAPPFGDVLPSYGSVIFQVTMTEPGFVLEQVGLLYFAHSYFAEPLGGWIPGAQEPDEFVDAVPLSPTSGVNGARFPDGLVAGQTSNLLFFLVDLDRLPREIPIIGFGPGGSYQMSATLLVPEPGTAALLAFALGWTPLLRRRCDRQEGRR